MTRTAEEQRDELRAILAATLALLDLTDPETYGEFINVAQQVLDRTAAEVAAVCPECKDRRWIYPNGILTVGQLCPTCCPRAGTVFGPWSWLDYEIEENA